LSSGFGAGDRAGTGPDGAGVRVSLDTSRYAFLGDADLRDAETVLANLRGWVDDYNTQAPHSALGMRSPPEYRAVTLRATVDAATASTAPPHLPQEARSSSGPLSGYPPKIGVEATRTRS
jgi:Integrase core domain